MALAFLTGASLLCLDEPTTDRWLHDAAVAARPRERWTHSAMVVLDDAIPSDVARIQLLPMYALAARHAIDAGARSVFFDGRVLASPDPAIPMAECAWPNRVKWIKTHLEYPFELSADAASRFSMLEPIYGSAQGSCRELDAAPHSLLVSLVLSLVGPQAANQVRLACTDVATPRSGDDGVERFFPIISHAAPVLMSAPEGASTWVPPVVSGEEECGLPGESSLRRCRRLRPSTPTIEVGNVDRPIVALSAIASCNENVARAAASSLRDRVVVMSPVAFAERQDLHATPLTIATSGHPFESGPQIIVDAVETLAAGDHPRRATTTVALMLIAFGALAGTLAAARLRATVAALVPIAAAIGTFLLSFVNGPVVVLWPTTAITASSALAVLAVTGLHLVFGTRQGKMAARYLPPQVRSLLSERGSDDILRGRGTFAAVLMSDLKGYSSATSLLETPRAIFALLNDYLEATTKQAQSAHQGWLEGYVGDLVCFYWPAIGDCSIEQASSRAVRAAVQLARLQREYFSSLPNREIQGVTAAQTEALPSLLGAGIGLAIGEVILGNLGPRDGVQKFGIIGDPLNAASRFEGLSRLFNGEIFVPESLAAVARAEGLVVRTIGRLRVKGRAEASLVYSVGEADDPRFAPHVVMAWNAWREEVEQGGNPLGAPSGLERDATTMHNWYARGVFDAATATWNLDEK